MSECKHQWNALAWECALCGKPIEEYIEELEAQLTESKLNFENADAAARKHFDLYNKTADKAEELEAQLEKVLSFEIYTDAGYVLVRDEVEDVLKEQKR